MPGLTFEQVQAKKTRRTITHPVITDDEAVLAYRMARQAVEDARARKVPLKELAALQTAASRAETMVRESTLLFRLRALPPDEYKALRAEHPPRPEDHAQLAEAMASLGEADQKARFNPDSFAPVLIAASLIEPEISLEQARLWQADWNDAEWAALFSAAILCNETATPTAGLVFS